MAWTQSDLDAIEAAIAKGEQSVQFADRLVNYRSLASLLEARAVIAASLSSRTRSALGAGDKGL